MPYFAVMAFDKPDSGALREELRSTHRAYGFANKSSTRFAGALYAPDGSQCGTLKIFEAENAEAVHQWYAAEPYFQAGLYAELRIMEWRLAFNQFEMRDYDLTAPGRIERAPVP